MKKLVIIGNWKMNKTFNESVLFMDSFAELYEANKKKIHENTEFAVALPFTNLAAHKTNKVKYLSLAAQDVSVHAKGAYTGDISVQMLKDLDVHYVILGHSERRAYHNESSELVNQKAKVVLEAGLVPVVCVGETLAEYEANQTKQVVKKQVEESLKGLDLSKVVLAYEPIWAIGTGKVATPQIAQDVCAYIRELTGKELVIQYGGSVNPKNIEELSSQKDIDGFLVGGASLEAESFVSLLTLGK
ncbi:triose-phosphate isomerase [Mycoplasmopsis alligatoris]|uniref:Triosephosphate isomerase n=1 Tax=Mycoplasmopsis alligatoris A21JP2 TaxID=747682 RepID=D4XVH2_9BACT|nr:triose-phosphate isomerase [Mycoplasmopsis alligatoris]EFF41689.1 triose-phosphate isomerase [Mycoplasmopsis alligatoris A21JP2]